jgi:hypothetical protein
MVKVQGNIALILLLVFEVGAGHAQSLPTATEAFNLRIKCKEMVAERDRDNFERNSKLGEFERKLISSIYVSRYDPKTNKCYGAFSTLTLDLQDKRQVLFRSLYDLQIDELMATWEDNNGQKSGMVIDKYNRGKYPPGKDAAEAFINEMLSDKQ